MSTGPGYDLPRPGEPPQYEHPMGEDQVTPEQVAHEAEREPPRETPRTSDQEEPPTARAARPGDR